MHIDRRIFLSRLDDLPIKGAAPLSDALYKAAAGADQIIILSAYYGADYLQRSFKGFEKRDRRSCSLTLVFGVDGRGKLLEAVEELRKLQKQLVMLGFPSPSVRVFSKEKPFHTKLYYFRRGKQPTWFVGSANASGAIDGDRHELMVRLSGRHLQLRDYMKKVVDCSVVVEEVPAESQIVYDLRSFFAKWIFMLSALDPH